MILWTGKKDLSMQIAEEHKAELEKLMRGSDCEHDFKCFKAGFEGLAKVKLIADGKIVECLEPDCRYCEQVLPFGYTYFCNCPIRCYAAQKMGLLGGG